MEISKTLYVTDRLKWRRWLEKNYKTAPEIWLIYYKKGSGKPRIDYNDAVEEALCFGWIDSIVKSIDENKYAQRYSPRKAKSNYSQTNRERLARLVAQGMVLPEVMEVVSKVMADDFKMPADILRAIKANKQAWKNFQTYSDGYRRIRIAFVDGARGRPEEFRKRLENLIKMSAQNKQFGFNLKGYY